MKFLHFGHDTSGGLDSTEQIPAKSEASGDMALITGSLSASVEAERARPDRTNECSCCTFCVTTTPSSLSKVVSRRLCVLAGEALSSLRKPTPSSISFDEQPNYQIFTWTSETYQSGVWGFWTFGASSQQALGKAAPQRDRKLRLLCRNVYRSCANYSNHFDYRQPGETLTIRELPPRFQWQDWAYLRIDTGIEFKHGLLRQFLLRVEGRNDADRHRTRRIWWSHYGITVTSLGLVASEEFFSFVFHIFLVFYARRCCSILGLKVQMHKSFRINYFVIWHLPIWISPCFCSNEHFTLAFIFGETFAVAIATGFTPFTASVGLGIPLEI